MDTETSVISIDDAADLPDATGCYWFVDETGEVMYVGKSKAIRKRVASYLTRLGPIEPHAPGMNAHGYGYERKLEQLVRFVKSVGYLLTDTELSALLWEHRLIKRFRPMYNETMRHDRRFFFLRVDFAREFPLFTTIQKNMRVKDEGESDDNNRAEFDIGPFYNTLTSDEALHNIGDFWMLPCCRKMGDKPCMRYHFKLCLGPCAGAADAAEYRARMEEAVWFFRYDKTRAQARYESMLRTCAGELDFERAAKIRDAYAKLNRWARLLARFPYKWHETYVVYAKAHREDVLMAAYAMDGAIRAWVTIGLTADIKPTRGVKKGGRSLDAGAEAALNALADYMAREECADDETRGKNFLRVPGSRAEGEEMWLALSDISAFKMYRVRPRGADGNLPVELFEEAKIFTDLFGGSVPAAR